jgi:hypothetical protein
MNPDRGIDALASVRLVAADYGFATADLKPCIAFLLDGNIGGAARHEAAFVIAIECRRMGLSAGDTHDVLRRFASRIGYGHRDAARAVDSAYRKDAKGNYRYHPPGVTKKPNTLYGRLLGPICADVDCPARCAPLAARQHGPGPIRFEDFERLEWPNLLRRSRHAALVDWYRAVCRIEEERGFAAGAPLYASYQQLAQHAGRDPSKAGISLDMLLALGLLSEFHRGSGDGPRARNRRASVLRRYVPIAAPPLGGVSAVREVVAATLVRPTVLKRQ